jgi:hypothetical protein
MPRPLSPALLTALSAPILNPALFVQAQFSDETVYMWSGVGSVTWNGHTWIGLGGFLGVTTPEDSSTVEAKGITLMLSGMDAKMLPQALNDVVLGYPVTVYLALYDSNNTLIDGPVVAWAGRLDQPTFEVGGTEVSLQINCESRLLDMNVGVDRRYTHEDNQLDNPGDLCFMFVDSIQEMTLFWGNYPLSSNNI